MKLFHGTDWDSALSLVRGQPLDAARAAAMKYDGPPGFFWTTVYGDATYFAARQAPGGILQYDVSPKAPRRLKRAGMKQQQIPLGVNSPRFSGDEAIIPVELFPLFNRLQLEGEVRISPAKGDS